MTQRISLDTLHGAKEPLGSFAPCAFSNGETNEAPECSAALVLSASLERFRREAHTGVCDTGRYRLTFRAWGQGPALIVVPGVAGNLETHVLPLSRLSRNFCCISYTLPAGGDDGATLANLTHDDLVADVVSLADHLGVKASAVWGTSFGATIALAATATLGRRHRRRIRGLYRDARPIGSPGRNGVQLQGKSKTPHHMSTPAPSAFTPSVSRCSSRPRR